MRPHPLLALLLATGCTGTLEAGAVDRPDTAVPPQVRCETRASAPVIRHLTRDEYDRTVRDLLGVESAFGEGFPLDAAIGGFEVGATVSPLLIEAQFEAADRLAEEASRDVEARLGCAPSAAGCVDGFLRRFTRRAFRRPASEDELARVRALYDGGVADGGPGEGLHRVIAGVLASPQFLYHLPPGRGAPGEIIELDSWEMASRLSYFLWGTMPDEALDAAADAGALSSPDALRAEARRMLEDPRAREGIGRFFRQWLGLDRIAGLSKDPALFPDMDADAADALHRSLELQMERAFFEGDARVSSLLLGRTVFLNEQLAGIYGVEGVEGEALVPVELDERERAGLLTHPGLLALHAKSNSSDPIHRGLFVRRQLLCQDLPQPPMDVDLVVPEPTPGSTTRDRFAEHTSNPSCRSCHQLIDPIGFTFEHYDAIGRYRADDQGLPVDASGELLATEDVDGPVEGAIELSERLAESWQVQGCMVRQWVRFGLAREEREEDACELEQLRRELVLADGDLRELVVAIAGSEAFRVRRIPSGGDDE